MATVEIELDVPEGVRVCGYERIEGGHAFEVEWTLPGKVTCEKCGRAQRVEVRWADRTQVVRDLDVWGQPGFFVYQPPYHRCDRCRHRQWLLPPFKRKHVTVTFRFEELVLRMIIGSTEEEVARKLGISAEMVSLIVSRQLEDEQQIDPQRVITDIGLDEISLKKRHRLYATILTDLTDPARPRILAVAPGRDQAAAEHCLNRLSEQQRKQVRHHRTDMSPAYTAAGLALLPHSQQVIDRFHVAKKLGEIVDRVRKKDAGVQKEAVCEGSETVPLADVGLSQTAGRPLGGRAGQAGGPV